MHCRRNLLSWAVRHNGLKWGFPEVSRSNLNGWEIWLHRETGCDDGLQCYSCSIVFVWWICGAQGKNEIFCVTIFCHHYASSRHLYNFSFYFRFFYTVYNHFLFDNIPFLSPLRFSTAKALIASQSLHWWMELFPVNPYLITVPSSAIILSSA